MFDYFPQVIYNPQTWFQYPLIIFLLFQQFCSFRNIFLLNLRRITVSKAGNGSFSLTSRLSKQGICLWGQVKRIIITPNPDNFFYSWVKIYRHSTTIQKFHPSGTVIIDQRGGFKQFRTFGGR